MDLTIKIFFFLTGLLTNMVSLAFGNEPEVKQYAISMHGNPKYSDPTTFTHFSCYNPKAPQGGTFNLAVVGRVFDTLNPFVFKGICPAPLGLGHYLTFDTLMHRSPEEPFTFYPRLAESVEMAEDRSWIIFNLDQRARFHDGTPVQAQDVLFTFKALRDYGSPARKMLAAKVKQIDILDSHRVKFTFNLFEGKYDRELPFIMAGMVVLSEASFKNKDFASSGLNPLMGSGPYRVTSVDPGKTLVLERVKNYWGKDLPAVQGLYNPAILTYHYFGTEIVAFEAFKAGTIDYWEETDLKRWFTDYHFPAITQGNIKKEEVLHAHQVGMKSFVFNTRHPYFKDRRVREALGLLFNFSWINQHLFHNAYTRTQSFFENTELAAHGSPTDQEREILIELTQTLKKGLPSEIFGSVPTFFLREKDERQAMSQAHSLFSQAGWIIKEGHLVHKETGEPFHFEILLNDPKYQRICSAFIHHLKKAGIQASARILDTAHYQQRLLSYDFDMIVYMYGHSLSPGTDQKLYWFSTFVNTPSRNYAGVSSSFIDKICDRIVESQTREELVTTVRVLDRLLRHGFYMIPLFHRAKDTIAYGSHIHHPVFTKNGLPEIYSWWVSPSPSSGKAK